MSHNETIAEETMPINSCNFISAIEITIKIYGNGKNLLMLKNRISVLLFAVQNH